MIGRPPRATLLPLLAACAVSLVTADVWAFCRATTCSPEVDNCPRDADDCIDIGAPLHWASNCLTLSVQSDASPQQGIDYQATVGVLQRAMDAWTNVDCAGQGPPSIRAQISDAVACAASEHNADGRNANIVMFREDGWPYPGADDAFALTRLRFGSESGQIWDADIELNATGPELSVGDPVAGADLDSILTHELGHLLGLDHTLEADATMFARYVEGDDSLRTPEPDDVAGICAVYPPDRKPATTSCEPRRGFSPLCGADQEPGTADPLEPEPPTEAEAGGCSVASPSSEGQLFRPAVGLALALLSLALRFRRRRARRSPVFE